MVAEIKRAIAYAEQQVCRCDDQNKKVIFLRRLDITPHELESLDLFYCMTCNSHWTEP
jgi:hypothetical protein